MASLAGNQGGDGGQGGQPRQQQGAGDAQQQQEKPQAPHPVWEWPGFAHEFCDPFIARTELQGGKMLHAVILLRHAVRRLMDNRGGRRHGGS